MFFFYNFSSLRVHNLVSDYILLNRKLVTSGIENYVHICYWFDSANPFNTQHKDTKTALTNYSITATNEIFIRRLISIMFEVWSMHYGISFVILLYLGSSFTWFNLC
jgi:hypothetical protein